MISKVTEDVLIVRLIVSRLGESAPGCSDATDELDAVMELPYIAWFVLK